MTVRWTFTDPQTLEVQTFEINPNDGGTPARQRTFTIQNNPASDGTDLFFQGRDKPATGSFSGVVRSQAAFDVMTTWFDDKPYLLELTDDLGRSYLILITELSLTMAPRRTAIWRHTYTVQFTVITADYTGVVILPVDVPFTLVPFTA